MTRGSCSTFRGAVSPPAARARRAAGKARSNTAIGIVKKGGWRTRTSVRTGTPLSRSGAHISLRRGPARPVTARTAGLRLGDLLPAAGHLLGRVPGVDHALGLLHHVRVVDVGVVGEDHHRV